MKTLLAFLSLLLLYTVVVDAFVASPDVGFRNIIESVPLRPFASTSALFQQQPSQVATIPAVTRTQTVLDRLALPTIDLEKQKKALYSTYQSLAKQSHKSSLHIQTLLAETWWAFPMTLCLVPLICKFILNVDAVTPNFWKMVDMQFVHGLPNAAATVAAFLFSNIAYFMSGLYLLLKSTSKTIKTTTLGRFSDWNLPRLAMLTPPPFTRTSALGYWILAAGITSTVFHSVQALGDYAVAESWCYLDHGVAISAGMYFLKVCGPPTKQTLALGIPGLFCLAITPQSAYTWLHSAWHFLSAGAAVAWGLQAHSGDEQVSKLELAYLLNGKLLRRATEVEESDEQLEA